jgi:hypothetical protein
LLPTGMGSKPSSQPTRARATRKTLASHAATRSSRGVIKRAASDLKQGLKNTDCRLPDKSSEGYCPAPAKPRRSKR